MAASRKSTRRRSPAKKIDAAAPLFAGYSTEKRPLGGYAVLAGIFTILLGGIIAQRLEADDEKVEPSVGDLILLSLATHKLSRIVAKDLVTSPFRAPFVKFKASAGTGEVEEEARGHGMQEAVGDLVSCPYCVAPWVASTLILAHDRAPRATRLVTSIFSITAVAHFLHHIYARLKP